MLVLRKTFVRVDVIHTDTVHRNVFPPKREDIIAKFAGFGGATWRVVLGIKIQHDPFALELLQRCPLPGLILQTKWRRKSADRKWLTGGVQR